MRTIWAFLGFALLSFSIVGLGADPRITIYNQNFAVVRQTVPLTLVQGVNDIRITDVTAHLEPDSVILRDPAGKRAIQVLEQNYRADPVSQELLLSLFEGKTIEFLLQKPDGNNVTVQGKIIRSGYVPHSSALQRYGIQYNAAQAAMVQGGAGQPIIEVDGKLRFNLPGIPLFPSLGDDTILKPMLEWLIASDQAGKFEAEMSYVTGGMNWQADYNIVAPERGDLLDIVGWVTIDNQSGKTFENAQIKLMAGDVNKIQPAPSGSAFGVGGGFGGGSLPPPAVSERTFDDYHIYDLRRAATVHDRETKQIEFIRVDGIKSARIYIYDGVKTDDRYRGYNPMSIRQDREYGVLSNPQVWVMREFVNSEANHLGMPLPQGRARFYRRDQDGRLEFTGESNIGHTPRDETIRVFTGSAFDLIGERARTDYRIDNGRMWLDESFEIKLRNHKTESTEVRVVEHLYRGTSWNITASSSTFLKTDSQTVEFKIDVGPGQEKVVTYTVHYTW
jgi:hypothetical protein